MKVALVTPSYMLDKNRCVLLSKSIDRWVDVSIDHIVIVPKKDIAAFSSLPTRSTVVSVESILPKIVWQLPMSHRWWLTLFSLPVRGWIMQQIVKISSVVALDYDAYVFVDSDIVIVKHVSPKLFVSDGHVRFYRVSGAGNTEMHARWHRSAAKLLGLDSRDYFGADYIGPFVSWDPFTTERMLKRIESVQNKHWFTTLCNTLHFSEYVLYGIYKDYLTEDRSRFFEDDQNLCHCCWINHIDSRKQLEDFASAIQEKHIAVLVQSNLGFDVDEYYDILRSRKLVE